MDIFIVASPYREKVSDGIATRRHSPRFNYQFDHYSALAGMATAARNAYKRINDKPNNWFIVYVHMILM